MRLIQSADPDTLLKIHTQLSAGWSEVRRREEEEKDEDTIKELEEIRLTYESLIKELESEMSTQFYDMEEEDKMEEDLTWTPEIQREFQKRVARELRNRGIIQTLMASIPEEYHYMYNFEEQYLEQVLAEIQGFEDLDPKQKMFLDIVAEKLKRITTGDSDPDDSDFESDDDEQKTFTDLSQPVQDSGFEFNAQTDNVIFPQSPITRQKLEEEGYQGNMKKVVVIKTKDRQNLQLERVEEKRKKRVEGVRQKRVADGLFARNFRANFPLQKD